MLRSQILICDRKRQQIKLQSLLILLQMLIFNSCIMIARRYHLHKGLELLTLKITTSYVLVLNQRQKQRLQ